MTNITESQLQQAIQQIDSSAKLSGFRQLMGGVSAQVIAMDIQRSDANTETWVLRLHGEADRRWNPNIAQDEYHLHSVLHKLNLPVPRPIHVDSSQQIFPIPYVIVEYIYHDATVPPAPIQPMVNLLAQIHAITPKQHDLSFLPPIEKLIDIHLKQEINHPHLQAMKDALPHLKQNPPSLLHGDYWTGNVLWQDGQIVAVIDWEDMMRGDPLFDLAISRLEILWEFGEGTMQAYTQYYQTRLPQLDYTYLPFWDLLGAWRQRGFASWSDDQAIVQQMQKQYDTFVDRAIRECKKFTP